MISDVWSRYKLQQGYYIIHPMGWDAFGLPAENYAIKMGVHPAVSTAENVKHIKEQINQIAALYDWDMAVSYTHLRHAFHPVRKHPQLRGRFL